MNASTPFQFNWYGHFTLVFPEDVNRKTLQLKGNEVIDLIGIEENLKPKTIIQAIIQRDNGQCDTVDLLCRIDTQMKSSIINTVEFYLLC